jgi:hypothetical protein
MQCVWHLVAAAVIAALSLLVVGRIVAGRRERRENLLMRAHLSRISHT